MSILLPFVFTAALLSAQEEPPPSTQEQLEAIAFLDEAKKNYHLPGEQGLKAFEVRLQPRKSTNQGLMKALNHIQVTYAWQAPDQESVDVAGIMEVFKKLIQEPLRGLYKDLAAGGVFPDLKDKVLGFKKGDEEVRLNLFDEGRLIGTALFDKESKLILHAEITGPSGRMKVEPVFSVAEGKLRLDEKSLVSLGKDGKERGRITYHYSAFLKVGLFQLPHKLHVDTGGDLLEFSLNYLTINSQPAPPPEADPEKVKALVKEYEKNYSKWAAPEKLKALKKLEETRHELAAQAIAKKGLKDRDLEVRKESAAALGEMQVRSVVSSLLKAMKTNEGKPEVYLEIIGALGNVGDPKAVSALSRDFWNQTDGRKGIKAAQAKIDALGKIRSKKSVEALIDLLYVAEPWAMRSVAINLRAALKSLTGQDFGFDRNRWRIWWKQNRSRFKLEED